MRAVLAKKGAAIRVTYTDAMQISASLPLLWRSNQGVTGIGRVLRGSISES